MDDFLDPSFLVSRLVQKLSPNDLKAMSLAVDMLKSFGLDSCEFNSNVFRERWTAWARARAKHAEVGLIESNIVSITRSVNRPTALFLLLDHLKNDKDVKQAPGPVFGFSNCGIPRDFLFVMQGMEGDRFKWNETQRRFVCSERLKMTLLEPAKRVSVIGCMMRSLYEFQELGDSLVQQFVACVVRDIVIEHMKFVALIEATFENLTIAQFMSYLMSPSIDELKASVIICSTICKMRATSVYNVLHLMTSHGDKSVVKVAERMKVKAMECIDIMIRDWSSKGEVDDPFNEFFVRCKGDIVIYSNWWHDSYFIASGIVPSTLNQDMVRLIFSAGKALNFLRKFDQPVELDIDRSLPLNEFVRIAYAQSNRLILGHVMRDDILKRALADIHSFALLGRGDFAVTLIDGDNPGQSKMHVLIRMFAGRTISDFVYKNGSKGGSITYEAKSPLSSVIGPYDLQAYKAVSLMMMRVKKCVCLLVGLETSTLQMMIIRFEFLNFTNLMYDFFQTQVISKSYATLTGVIDNPDVEFDNLLADHARHASSIARGCWMSSSGREVHGCLMEILDLLETVQGASNLKELRDAFHSLLFRFRTLLLTHQVSGRALVAPLTKCFCNVFK